MGKKLKHYRPLTDAMVQQQFDLIVAAARKGERCPQTEPYGPISAWVLKNLYLMRMLQAKISGHNWRQMEILVGPYRGAKTAPDPFGNAPWKIVNHLGAKMVASRNRPRPNRAEWAPKELDR